MHDSVWKAVIKFNLDWKLFKSLFFSSCIELYSLDNDFNYKKRNLELLQGIPNSLRATVWMRLGGLTEADIEENYKHLYDESRLHECPHEQVK